jgi:hypothetical protein
MKSFSKFMVEKQELLLMSAASDRYEKEVADYLNSIQNVKASRPKVSTKYSDVVVEYKGKKAWLEVKMSHTDNLGNPRVTWMNNKWTAAAPLDPVKKFAIEYLTKSPQTKAFLKDIAEYVNIPVMSMILPSTKGLLSKPNAVPYESLVGYFENKNQYILDVKNVDLGKLVTAHYLEGKAEPAYYMQAGDDFYMIGSKNPLGLPSDVPKLSGKGSFKMRIGIRSKSSAFYEIQPEIKIMDMPKSKYSVKPGTKKKNPFNA